MDFLKSVDTWFLIICVGLLGGFFLWAVKYIFNGLKQSIDDLDQSVKETSHEMKRLIEELFINRNDHEKRLTAIETKCNIQHYDPSPRLTGGRRWYDPITPPPKGESHDS